jgi:hypothetical protein
MVPVEATRASDPQAGNQAGGFIAFQTQNCPRLSAQGRLSVLLDPPRGFVGATVLEGVVSPRLALPDRTPQESWECENYKVAAMWIGNTYCVDLFVASPAKAASYKIEQLGAPDFSGDFMQAFGASGDYFTDLEL